MMNNSVRILLVDDSPYFLEAARDFLHYQEFLTVVGVASGEDEALNLSRELEPDIILLDLNLASSSGLELIPIFKESLPDTRVIVLTMMEETSYRAAALQAGADGFVHKSTMSKTLLSTILKAVERSVPAPADEQAKQTQRLGEAYFQSMLDDISELICRFLPDGTLTYVNDAYCRYYGKSRAELIGSNFISTAADDFPQKLLDRFKSFSPDQPTSTFEQYDILPNGEKRWREWVDRAFFDQDGSAIEFQSTGRDITERKQAEEALRDREAHWSGLINSTLDAIIAIDEEQRILHFNPAAEQLFLCPAAEAVGSSITRFIPEGAPEKHQEYVRAFGSSNQTRRSMRTPALELNCLRADGKSFPSEISISQFEVGGQKRFIASIRDITERKRAEQQLRHNESRYRLATKATNDVIWEWIPETHQLMWSENAPVVFGYSSEEIGPEEKWWDERLHPEDRERILSKLSSFFAGNESIWQEEYRFRLQDGSYAHISDHALIERGADGNVVRMIGAMTDITKRTQAEAKVQQQLRRLAALREIDLAIASTFDMYVSLKVLLSQTMKLLGVDAADVLLVDAPFYTLKYGAGIGFRTSKVQTASIRLGESYAGRVALERLMVKIPNLANEPTDQFMSGFLEKEGFAGYHGAPLVVKGRVVGVLEVFDRSVVERDEEWLDFLSTLAGQAAIAVDNAELFRQLQQELAERRLVEEQLRKLNSELEQRVTERTAELLRTNTDLERALRVKDEFLANMSHELRTPLNAILGLSESLGEQTAGELNEKQQKYVHIISESGHHLLALINDILDLAKIEAGQIILNHSKVDIKAVCESSVRMVKQLVYHKNQDLALDMDPRLDLVWVDERRLKQMLVNLLSNAVKFTHENGRIGLEVRGNRDNNQITFTVWDTGIGIPEKDVARLFRPFVQLDSDLARKATGTGLGLALVAQMARLHGGSVHAISQVGTGSRFTIRLPWESALPTETSSKMKFTGKFRASQPGDENLRPAILLIEDTDEVIMMLRDYLEYSGYRVTTARNGSEGIVQAKQVHPDLILMDVQMTGMDGLEATQRLRREPGFEKTPILALTALAMPNDRQRCLAAGMDEYMSKPVNLKALVKMIQRFIP